MRWQDVTNGCRGKGCRLVQCLTHSGGNVEGAERAVWAANKLPWLNYHHVKKEISFPDMHRSNN